MQTDHMFNPPLPPAPYDSLLPTLVATLSDLPGIVAVALGGSARSGFADVHSDLDLHVYWQPPLAAPEQRTARLATIADAGSVRVGVQSWGLEDHLRIDGRLVELVYLHWGDTLAEIDRAYDSGLNSESYATAFLYTAAHDQILHDPHGGLATIQARLRSYPAATYRVLLERQPALLRFYTRQLGVAQARGDLLFAQQRRYTIQMVFFNLLFALNQQYHPGEKRLLTHLQRCSLQPAQCAERWQHAARLAVDDPALSSELTALGDDLLALVARQGFKTDAYPW
jgi:hypothetical protein